MILIFVIFNIDLIFLFLAAKVKSYKLCLFIAYLLYVLVFPKSAFEFN